MNKPIYSLSIDKFVKVLKEDFFFNLANHANLAEEKELLESTIVNLKKLAQSEYAEIQQTSKIALHALETSYAREFLRAMVRNKTKNRRGKVVPWESHLSIVVVALELAKGNKKLLHRIRQILQTRFDKEIKPSNESIFYWTKALPKDSKKIPTFLSVTRVNGQKQETHWANEMKRAYLLHLEKSNQRASKNHAIVLARSQSEYPKNRSGILRKLIMQIGPKISTLETQP